MAFASGDNKGVRSDINITPLVDVVLVLLIIFMVMTPTQLKEMDVAVPDKAEVQLAMPQATDQIVVSLSREGNVSINRERINMQDLAGRINRLMTGRSDKLVFMDIDDDANYGEALHVMDVCRGSGAKTLGLMTK